jgi:hypothetical protein
MSHRSILTAIVAIVATGAAVLVAFDDASARGYRGGHGFRGGGFQRAMSHRAAMPRMGRSAMPRMGRTAMGRPARAAMPRMGRPGRAAMGRPGRMAAPRAGRRMSGRAIPRGNRIAQRHVNRLGPRRVNRLARTGAGSLGRPNVNRVGQPGTNRGRENASAARGGLPKVNLAQFDRSRGAKQRATGRPNSRRSYAQMAPTAPQPPAATPAAPANGGNGMKQRARQKVITIRANGWRLDARLRAAWEFDERVRLGPRANPPLTAIELKRIDDAGGVTEMLWLNKKEMEEVINRAIEENNRALEQALEEARQAEAWRE